MQILNQALEEIYKEFGEQICLYTYFGVFYDGHTIFPCTEITGNSASNYKEWTVDHNVVTTFSNSQFKTLRRHYIEKSCHDMDMCKVCSFNEQNNFGSSRQAGNNHFAELYPTPGELVNKIRTIIQNDFYVDELLYLHWFPSNYCNYECIMCSGASSTKRHQFEIKHLNKDKVISILSYPAKEQPVEQIYEILKSVNGIGFTGGETLLQPEVIAAIDYLIKIDRAQYVKLNFLTNASSFPDDVVARLKKFKQVVYSVSVDGTGDIIEYQRRGAIWATVAANTLKIRDNFSIVINFVITAVSIFGVIDFVKWISKHKLIDITFFPVKEPALHLSLDVLPAVLKNELLTTLKQEKTAYSDELYYLELLDSVIDLLELSQFNQTLFNNFVTSIRIEDGVSNKSLIEIIPEWAPYFET